MKDGNITTKVGVRESESGESAIDLAKYLEQALSSYRQSRRYQGMPVLSDEARTVFIRAKTCLPFNWHRISNRCEAGS